MPASAQMTRKETRYVRIVYGMNRMSDAWASDAGIAGHTRDDQRRKRRRGREFTHVVQIRHQLAVLVQHLLLERGEALLARSIPFLVIVASSRILLLLLLLLR